MATNKKRRYGPVPQGLGDPITIRLMKEMDTELRRLSHKLKIKKSQLIRKILADSFKA